MRRVHKNWYGQQMLTQRANPVQDVNTSLTPKFYAKLAPELLFASCCGAGRIGDAPVFVLAVCTRNQNAPEIVGILFVSEWRHRVLTLYFGPEFLSEPDHMAQPLAFISAAALASANAASGLIPRGTRAEYTSRKITHRTLQRHTPLETLP
jgi:hypothetical protein